MAARLSEREDGQWTNAAVAHVNSTEHKGKKLWGMGWVDVQKRNRYPQIEPIRRGTNEAPTDHPRTTS